MTCVTIEESNEYIILLLIMSYLNVFYLAFYFYQAIGVENSGIGNNSGTQWKHQKTASLAILKKMGLGRNDLAEKIQAEVDQYLTELSKFEGTPKDIKFLTDLSTCNVICSILVGQAFDYNDVTFVRVVELITTIMANFALPTR